MSGKLKVGILFGGQSAEHEVSLQSAKNIIAAIDRAKYDIVLIGIDRDGRWYLQENEDFLRAEDDPRHITLQVSGREITLAAGNHEKQLIPISEPTDARRVDVVFPVLHGPMGEDGTVQGLLKLAQIPFVGGDVLGSAVGMDKDVMKRLLRDAGLPIGAFITLRRHERARLTFADVRDELGVPVFIKPANMGSSVGVHRAGSEEEFAQALDDAFRYDSKVVIEAFIEGREIECSVLGNEHPSASVPGEVIPSHEFYSYEAKYLDEHGAALRIPADLPEAVVARVQELAVATFQALNCEGMARVDFFLRGDSELIVNEINTIPGFTRISMYPKLWEASGLSYATLIERLITLALERHERDRKLLSRVDF